MPAAEPPDLRWMAVVSLVETVSLVVLLANLATAHIPQVASARTRLLTLVPAIGGLLALSRALRSPSNARRPEKEWRR